MSVVSAQVVALACSDGGVPVSESVLQVFGVRAVKQGERERVVKGISAYRHEQDVILRLLRKRGRFTSREFDCWFRGREYRRGRLRGCGISGDSFLLGIGANGMNDWAWWLDLVQQMMRVGLVDARSEGDVIVYSAMNGDRH